MRTEVMEASTAQKKGYLLRFGGGGGVAGGEAASGLPSRGASASGRCAMASGSRCSVLARIMDNGLVQFNCLSIYAKSRLAGADDVAEQGPRGSRQVE